MPIFPHKHPRYEFWIVLGIMLVAVVFRFQDIKMIPSGLYPDEALSGNIALHAIETGNYNVYYPDNNVGEGLFVTLQAQSIKLFGNTPWALRVVSGLFGTLTVLGLYFLTRKLFNWQIAAMSSFLLAVSFWHTLFSRIGFRAIMAPFFLVWGLYFFWRGKTSTKLFDFAMAGLFIGLGFYSYTAYRIMPFVVVVVACAYWFAIKNDFGHEKYLFIRHKLLRGLAMMMVTGIIVAIPLGWYFLMHPSDFLGRISQISILPIAEVTELFWPIEVLFVVGFMRSLIKLLKHKQKHGHHPTVQVLLLSWFIVGLLPVAFSNEGLSHAMGSALIVPVVMIFAGEGLWWLYDFCRKWYHLRDEHEVAVHEYHGRESNVVAGIAVFALLIAIMLSEYQSYFIQWAQSQSVVDSYAADYVALGELLNQMPRGIKKYVVVNKEGAFVNSPDLTQSIAIPAQTVMFITDTWTPGKQKIKNIFYITKEQYQKKQYPKDAVILPLNP